jgi:hypothetical protein
MPEWNVGPSVSDEIKGSIYYKQIGYYVAWIYEDKVELFDDITPSRRVAARRVYDTLTVYAYDNNLFPLLSNRLDSLAKGFRQALRSRKIRA